MYDLEKEPVSRKQVQRKWKQDKRTLDETSGRAESSSGLSALGNLRWARPPALGGTWGSWVARGAMAGAWKTSEAHELTWADFVASSPLLCCPF